jgi:hypothetical protein
MKTPKPIDTVQDALRLLDSFNGAPEDFELAVSDRLHDPVGVNIAMVTDRILQRGWQPNGFTQEAGFRVYRYEKLD